MARDRALYGEVAEGTEHEMGISQGGILWQGKARREEVLVLLGNTGVFLSLSVCL